MLRRLVVLALIAAVVGFGVFWVVTIPATVPASALAPHSPNLDNGKTMFSDRRLRLLPRHAGPGRQDAARRRLRPEIAVRHLLRAEHLARSERRHRQWSEANFVTAMVKGTSPDGRHYFPAFPYTSYQRMKHRRPARPVRLSEDAAGGAGRIEAARRAVPVQHPPHARRLEIPVPRRQAVRAATRPRTRPGIAAPIWSTVRATAPNVIRRAISSAASSKASASPAGLTPAATAWCRTSRRRALSMSHEQVSSSCSKPARRRTATPSAARWPKVTAQHRSS